jgi:ribosomal protein S18 acetylase RimI-like enzyme
MSEVRIVGAGSDRLPDIEPLWRSLHDHHVTVDDPRLAAIRREQQNWTGRREGFERVLSRTDAFMVLAEVEGRPVGYAVVDVRDRAENWRITGDRYADLESIAVLPDARGRGIGTALLREIYRRLRTIGVMELTTRVVVGNTGARRFYERAGFLPSTLNYHGRIPE